MRIQGAITLITGASEGIGAACATEFRRRGAKLALVARTREKLEAISQPGDLILPADLLDPASRKYVVDKTVEHRGRIDILVNNAGVGLSEPSWKAEMSDVRRLFELNVFAALELMQHAVRDMRSRRGGMIVNVGSVAGKIAMPWFTVYSATKFTLGALTNGARMELENDGIRMMLVCPGFVRTDFQKHALGGPPPGARQRGRPGEITPEHCAARIADGVERNKRTVVTPRSAWFLIAASRLFPASVDRLLTRLNERGIE